MRKKTNIIAKTQERALSVTAEEAATFPYDHVDVLIAQNMLSGVCTPADLAQAIGAEGVTDVTVRHRLLDPVRCAWISQQMIHAIGTRLGQVMGAVYGRAVTTGDPNSAKLLLQQYGALVEPVARTEHVNMTLDLSKLPPDVLERMVADKMRLLGLQKETKSAECEVKP